MQSAHIYTEVKKSIIFKPPKRVCVNQVGLLYMKMSSHHRITAFRDSNLSDLITERTV